MSDYAPLMCDGKIRHSSIARAIPRGCSERVWPLVWILTIFRNAVACPASSAFSQPPQHEAMKKSLGIGRSTGKQIGFSFHRFFPLSFWLHGFPFLNVFWFVFQPRMLFKPCEWHKRINLQETWGGWTWRVCYKSHDILFCLISQAFGRGILSLFEFRMRKQQLHPPTFPSFHKNWT